MIIKDDEYFLVTGYSSTIFEVLYDEYLSAIPKKNFIFLGRKKLDKFNESIYINVDFNNLESLQKSIKLIENMKVKYMFLNHGILIGKSSTEYSFEELINTVNVNVTSYVAILSALGKNLIDGGSTILMSSVSAKNGSYDDVYSASKGFIESYMKSFVYKIGTHRLNCVAPGITLNTRMTNVRNDLDNIENKRLQTPLKKLAQPLDIAKTIHFLLSDDSSHLTKCVIPIDGGI